MIEIFIRNKKILLSLFSFLVIGAFSAPTVFAVWSGTFYSAGETLNPECSPTDVDCDVLPPLSLKETGAGTDLVTIAAPASIGTSFTLTLPSDDGTASQYLQTDGSGNLTWATVSSGLTTGTTAITSGTDTRVLFNDGGVLGEDSGFTFIKATDTLTLTGGISTATLAGGATASGTAKALIVNNGTSTGNIFEAQDNGTAVFSIIDGGNVGIGTTAPVAPLDLVVPAAVGLRVKSTAALSSVSGGTVSLYTNAAPTAVDQRMGRFTFGYTDDVTNYDTALIAAFSDEAWTIGSARGTHLRFETTAPGSTLRREKLRITGNGNIGIGISAPTAKLHVVQTATATGALTGMIYTGAVNTNQTLSTEIPSLTLTTAGREWATGALATQREVLITQPTYSFVGASTITDAATVGIAGAPIKSTNASITNTHGLLIQSGAVSTATNSYGLTVNAQTGATNNYSATFLGGNVGIGTTTPTTAKLHVTGTTGTTIGAIVDNGTSTGNIFEAQDNGTAIFQIKDGAAASPQFIWTGSGVTFNSQSGSLILLDGGGGGLYSNPTGGSLHLTDGDNHNRFSMPYTASSSTINNNFRLEGHKHANTSTGYGTGLLFQGRSSTTADNDMIRLSGVWTDATHATRSAAIVFETVNNAGSLTERMRIGPTGSVQLNSYGSGTFTGTPAYTLQVDALGNIIEGSAASGGLTTGTTTITSGTDTRVLFNDGGVLGEDAGFTFTKATDTLNLGTGIKTMTDVPLHITSSGSTSGVLIGNAVSVANRALIGANTSSSYLVVATGSSGLLFSNNGQNTFRGSISDAGNWRVASDGTLATAKMEIEATSGGSQKTLTLNNSTSTGNIFEAQDNGTAVFTVANGGNTTITNLSAGTTVGLTVNMGESTGSALTLNSTAGTDTTLTTTLNTGTIINSSLSLKLQAAGGLAGELDLNYGSGISYWKNYSARQMITLNYNEASSSAKNSGFRFTGGQSSTSAGYGNGLTIAGASATVADRDMVRLSGVWTTATDASRTSAMTFDTVNSAGSLTERMRILGDGSVGIGTSTPTSTLTVVGTTSFSGGLTTIDDLSLGAMVFESDAGILSWVDMPVTASAAINTVESYIAQLDGNPMLSVYGLSDGAGGVKTKNLGVGIGTSTPLLRLDVAGSGRVTGTATSVLTGTIDPTASTTVTGVGTLFTTELVVGDRITVTGETRTVTAIASATSLTVDTAFTDNANDTAPDKLNAILLARNSSSAVQFVVNDLGYVGVGTSAPVAPLEVKGTGTGAVIAKFTDVNTTGCTLDTGGTISCSSDERLKKNIEVINYGLDTVMLLRPVLYNWKYETDGTTKSLGFIAQEVEAIIPKLVSTDILGMKSLNTTAMMPVLTKAIQELNLNLEGIAGTIAPLAGSETETFVTAFFENIFSRVGQWLADASNGITNIFAGEVETQNLCVSDGAGAKTCITKTQLDALILNAGITAPEPAPEPTPEPAPTETCTDGIQNQDETSVDTGGICVPVEETPAEAPTCVSPQILVDDVCTDPEPEVVPEPEPEPTPEEPAPEPEPTPEVTP